jgi:hypothetical protein
MFFFKKNKKLVYLSNDVPEGIVKATFNGFPRKRTPIVQLCISHQFVRDDNKCALYLYILGALASI